MRETATNAVNQDTLDEYLARNNQALTELIEVHGVELRKLPDDVIEEFRAISEKILDDLAKEDETISKVYDSYSKFKNDVTNVDEIKKIKIESFYYEVPEYLISKKIPDKASNYLIKKSLYFTRHIIQNRFFIPNNLTFPKSRILFENYFN